MIEDVIEVRPSLPEWVAQRLRALGRSQAWLAREADIDPGHLSLFLRGEKEIGTAGLVRLAHALAVPPERVFIEAGYWQAGPVSPELEAVALDLAELPSDDQTVILEMFRRTVAAFRAAHHGR